MISKIQDDMFNYVLRAHFTEKTLRNRIDHVIHVFKQYSLPFSWWAGELDTLPTLKKELSKKGLSFKEKDIGMVLELEKFQLQSRNLLDFRWVSFKALMQDFASVITAIRGNFDCYQLIYSHLPLDLLQGPFKMCVGYYYEQIPNRDICF